jgi:hypothetical protein
MKNYWTAISPELRAALRSRFGFSQNIRRIINLHQGQTTSRSHGRALRAIGSDQSLARVIRRPFAFTDMF